MASQDHKGLKENVVPGGLKARADHKEPLDQLANPGRKAPRGRKASADSKACRVSLGFEENAAQTAPLGRVAQKATKVTVGIKGHKATLALCPSTNGTAPAFVLKSQMGHGESTLICRGRVDLKVSTAADLLAPLVLLARPALVAAEQATRTSRVVGRC